MPDHGVVLEQPPLAYPAAVRALAGCVANTARLICQRRMHLPSQRVGMRLNFADGTSARVFRETVVDRGATADPCVLVVEFRLRAVRGRGHAAFRRESLLNTPLLAGFAGFVSKLWLADDGLVAAGRNHVRTADVLVVGAGPAGLALALQAHDHGAAVRVIDRRPEADRPSRALILHSRTLETLRPLGVTQALLGRADTAPTADLQLGSRVIRVTLAGLALPDTAFPHLSLIRQTDAERVLAEALADRGIKVERATELIGVRDGPGGARAVLRSPATTEQALFGFVAGCDGPASTVRAQAGIGWPGRTYPVEVVLADAELDGDLAGDAVRVAVGRRGLVFAFRLGELATWRLLATRTAGSRQSLPGQFGPPVPVAEVQALMDEAGLGAQIAELAWSSRIVPGGPHMILFTKFCLRGRPYRLPGFCEVSQSSWTPGLSYCLLAVRWCCCAVAGRWR